MLPSQKAAVDLNMVELVESIEWTAPAVLSYFQTGGIFSKRERDLVESKVIDADKLTCLFHILKSKDSGWSLLISYLKSNNQSSLAAKLLNGTGARAVERGSKPMLMPKPRLNPKPSVLKQFSLRLATYYQSNYANVPAMWESPKHVKDVWVPLQIDGREFLAADRIDHVELLNRLKSNQSRNVALIKGDPGMGKTTLAKKIAYDWAVKYISTCSQQFSLVLAVPLRSAGKSPRFDQLAIDYFLSVLDMEAHNLKELIGEINQMGPQLLVILDGLDEYVNYSESPFRNMFALPFKQFAAYSNVPPPITTFKLIITSRPYACERINEECFPLRFVILHLDEKHLGDFVRLYCESSQGIAKVTEYLHVNADLVIKVPLILTFICYLADSDQEIPTNMTSLYDSFIRQMIRRESRQGKLTEPVDIHKWKDSNVVKTTGELAFSEIKEENFEFPSNSLKKNHVTNDSFICGFLLHKFDFAKDLLKVEFPDRSIQEFFAALHCYQLMLAGCKDELGDIRKLILTGDSQFGRFLFGICSKEHKFDRMTDWLSPSLSALDYPWIAINLFGTNLIDCLPQDDCLLGHTLFHSFGDVKGIIGRSWDSYLPVSHNFLSSGLRESFKAALNLVEVQKDWVGRTYEWCIADQKNAARLVVAKEGLVALLKTRFNQVDILIWHYQCLSANDWKMRLSRIKLLLPVRTLVMETRVDGPFKSVTICICYGWVLGTELALTEFRFTYVSKYRDELLKTIENEKMVDLTVVEPNEPDEDKGFRKLKVTVNNYNQSKHQPELIFALIRQSLL